MLGKVVIHWVMDDNIRSSAETGVLQTAAMKVPEELEKFGVTSVFGGLSKHEEIGTDSQSETEEESVSQSETGEESKSDEVEDKRTQEREKKALDNSAAQRGFQSPPHFPPSPPHFPPSRPPMPRFPLSPPPLPSSPTPTMQPSSPSPSRPHNGKLEQQQQQPLGKESHTEPSRQKQNTSHPKAQPTEQKRVISLPPSEPKPQAKQQPSNLLPQQLPKEIQASLTQKRTGYNTPLNTMDDGVGGNGMEEYYRGTQRASQSQTGQRSGDHVGAHTWQAGQRYSGLPNQGRREEGTGERTSGVIHKEPLSDHTDTSEDDHIYPDIS